MSEDQTNDRSRWLPKIEALLRKAEDKGVTPEEAATFTAKAEQLMAKWKIEASELRAQQPGADPRDAVSTLVVVVWKSATMNAEVQLLLEIADAHDCPGSYYTFRRRERPDGRLGAGRQFTFWGMPEDLAAVELLFASLKLQATQEYTSKPEQAKRRAAVGTGPSAGGLAIRYKNSWMQGYAFKIGARLQEIRKHQHSQVSDSTALVLYNAKAAVQQVYDEKHKRAKQGKAMSGGQGGAGFGSGWAAGERAKLNDTIGA